MHFSARPKHTFVHPNPIPYPNSVCTVSAADYVSHEFTSDCYEVTIYVSK